MLNVLLDALEKLSLSLLRRTAGDALKLLHMLCEHLVDLCLRLLCLVYLFAEKLVLSVESLVLSVESLLLGDDTLLLAADLSALLLKLFFGFVLFSEYFFLGCYYC